MVKIKRSFILFTSFFFFTYCHAQSDPFSAYINTVPSVIKKIEEKDSAGVITTRFVFASRDKQNAVYAILSKPKGEGRHPAILFLHGGGSRAEDLAKLAAEYAMRGYVTMSIDQPGICNSQRAVNSDGPWKSKPGGEAPRFDMSGGPQTSTLVDAEIAGLEAFNFLQVMPEVNAAKMGITGFSWGGYSTTMLAGLLGKKVKAAYAVFGCGFYEQGSFWKDMIAKMTEVDRKVWLTYLDAGRRAPSIKAAYFLDEASNDTYFWPEAAGATLAAIRSSKNRVWNPNFNHKQSAHGPGMQRIFFDYYLKGEGQRFGKIEIKKLSTQKDGSISVALKIDLPANIQQDSVLVYYSRQDVKWQERKWLPLAAAQKDAKNFVVTIPDEVLKNKINFYAYLLDSRGVTTSSEMR